MIKIPKAAITAAAKAINAARLPFAAEQLAEAALTAAAPFMQEEQRRLSAELDQVREILHDRERLPTFADGIEAAADAAQKFLIGPLGQQVAAVIRALKSRTGE